MTETNGQDNGFSVPMTRSQLSRPPISVATSSQGSSTQVTPSDFRMMTNHDSMDSSNLLLQNDVVPGFQNNQGEIQYPPFDPEAEGDDSSYSEDSESDYTSDDDDEDYVPKVSNGKGNGKGNTMDNLRNEPCHLQPSTPTHLPSFPSLNHPNMNHVALTGLHVQQHQNQFLNLHPQPFLAQTNPHGPQVLVLPASTSYLSHPHPTTNYFRNYYAHPFLNSSPSSFHVVPNHTITSEMASTSSSVTLNGQPRSENGAHTSNPVRYTSIEEDHYYTDLSMSIPHRKNENGPFDTSSSNHNITIPNGFLANEPSCRNGEDDLSVGSNCSYETQNTESSCEPIEIEATSDQCLNPSSEDDNFGEIIKQTMQVDSITASV